MVARLEELAMQAGIKKLMCLRFCCMLLYAAGETIDGCTIRRTSNAGQNKKAHVPQILLHVALCCQRNYRWLHD